MASSSGHISVLAVSVRAAAFLAFWLILAGVNVADLPAAAAAVVAAVWASFRLMPLGGTSIANDASSKGSLPFVFRILTCSGSRPELLLQRSPPWSFATAAWSGLGPAPESRSRGASPHLPRSFTTSLWLTSFHSASAAHMNYATSFAADSECASTFLRPRDVITPCAEQPSPLGILEAA
jgi:hypothetical protein